MKWTGKKYRKVEKGRIGKREASQNSENETWFLLSGRREEAVLLGFRNHQQEARGQMIRSLRFPDLSGLPGAKEDL